MDRHDIRMAQHGNSLALRVEAVTELFVLAQLVLQDLHGNQSVQPMAAGLIDHRHATKTNGFQDLIPAIQQAADVLIVIHSCTPFRKLSQDQHAGHIVR